MANTVRSRKAKGFGFQKKIAEQIREEFNLEPRDVVSNPSSCKGEDILLSEKAKFWFPFAVECKNQEKLNIWSSLTQAEMNAGDLAPIVIFKRNRTKPYVALEWDFFLNLIHNSFDEEQSKYDASEDSAKNLLAKNHRDITDADIEDFIKEFKKR